MMYIGIIVILTLSMAVRKGMLYDMETISKDGRNPRKYETYPGGWPRHTFSLNHKFLDFNKGIIIGV